MIHEIALILLAETMGEAHGTAITVVLTITAIVGIGLGVWKQIEDSNASKPKTKILYLVNRKCKSPS